MTNPNDPAFPEIHSDPMLADKHGLTKREYFAAMALHGLLAAGMGVQTSLNPGQRCTDHAEMAVGALSYADALIVELSK